LHSDYLSNIAAISGSQMILRDHPLLLACLIVFGFSFLVQAFYYIYYFLATARYKPADNNKKYTPVSVIICARNEEENLRNFLPAVLEQDYPDFEVVVVNDCSEDDSYNILGDYLKKYPNLKVSNIIKDPKFTHNKKFAQFIGIKAAKNELLLFTDADCRPESEKWIAGLVSGFNDGIDFVLGYGGFFAKNGLLNKYIRYDTLTIAMQYLSFAISGFPFMGVGRNIVYRKSFFNGTSGFTRHLHLLSGDDDLFVNENATGKNTAVEFSHASHTRSAPSQTFEKWIWQKKRHLTTAPLYKARDKFLLGLESFSRLCFYILLAVLLFVPGMLWWALGAFLFRLIVQGFVIKNAMIRLKENNLLLYSILFDVISLFINFGIFVSNRLSARKRQWK